MLLKQCRILDRIQLEDLEPQFIIRQRLTRLTNRQKKSCFFVMENTLKVAAKKCLLKLKHSQACILDGLAYSGAIIITSSCDPDHTIDSVAYLTHCIAACRPAHIIAVSQDDVFH